MGSANIPPNDPKAPRWLLDLKEWKTFPFSEIPRDILDIQGYGIVSYTWGYIKETKPASDPPDGLLWDNSGVKLWDLSTARRVMGTMGCRYVWSDWIKSIVWLHSTSWGGESPLEVLVSLKSPDADNCVPADIKRHVDQVKHDLEAARIKEYWLCSGRTLQEGVLLHETDLIDHNGKTLPGIDFWMTDQATVSDLTVPITKLATELALGYFIKTRA
ncbi:hypothetical protein N7520_007465 [Penicillium odoratum]|uniref:uncharacterized protein n=1 Tax=Penicillium odoratum TaxID=1167516 RepID=UPI0025499D04|nr:uncharacterized protein N7520_007465 [Penicillium odoratum]KAJ5760309.1 hypothetical protein N7520_007465 [Penicillium odoratum]